MAKKYEDMTKAEKEEVQLKNERARNPKEFDTKKKNTEIATQKVHAMPDGTKMKGAKHGMKAGGYVLSAKDKARKESFESSPPAKKGIPIKKSATKKMKHGGLVDRNYLKGK